MNWEWEEGPDLDLNMQRHQVGSGSCPHVHVHMKHLLCSVERNSAHTEVAIRDPGCRCLTLWGKPWAHGVCPGGRMPLGLADQILRAILVYSCQHPEEQKSCARGIKEHGKAQSNKKKVCGEYGSGGPRTQGGSSANTQHKFIWWFQQSQLQW